MLIGRKKTNTCIDIIKDKTVTRIDKEIVLREMVNDGLILPETPTEFNVKF